MKIYLTQSNATVQQSRSSMVNFTDSDPHKIFLLKSILLGVDPLIYSSTSYQTVVSVDLEAGLVEALLKQLEGGRV